MLQVTRADRDKTDHLKTLCCSFRKGLPVCFRHDAGKESLYASSRRALENSTLKGSVRFRKQRSGAHMSSEIYGVISYKLIMDQPSNLLFPERIRGKQFNIRYGPFCPKCIMYFPYYLIVLSFNCGMIVVVT
jgi:hypothetical protein